jgi:para-nitrobenzyl esterase
MDTIETWDKGATDMLGDDLFGVHMRFIARQNAQSGAPTYLYQFTRVPPSRNQTIGAYHAAEISFVFDSHLPLVKLNESDRKLTDRMVSYWTNFAKTGNPNGERLPEWPATSPEGDVWMELGPSPKPIEGLRARKLDILEEALRQRIDTVAGPKAEPPPPPEPEPGALPILLDAE